jgi:hypothetical protein
MANGQLFEAFRASGGGGLARGLQAGLNIGQSIQSDILARQQLKAQNRQRQIDNDIRTSDRLLTAAGNKNLPDSLRVDSLNGFINIHNQNFPNRPIRNVSIGDFGDKKARGIIDQGINKQLGLFKNLKEGKLGSGAGARRRFGMLLAENNLETARRINSETEKVIDVKTIQSLTRQPKQGKPFVVGDTVFDPVSQKFIPAPERAEKSLERITAETQARAKGTPPRRQSASEIEKARILSIREDERTDEEKKFIGTFIPPETTKSDELSLRKRLSSIELAKEKLARGGVTKELRDVLGPRNAELLNALRGGAKDPVSVKAASDALDAEAAEIRARLGGTQTIRPQSQATQPRSITGDEEFDTFFTGQ